MKTGHEAWMAKIVVAGQVRIAHSIYLQGDSFHPSIMPWGASIFGRSILCSLGSLDKFAPADRIDRRIDTLGSVCNSPQNLGSLSHPFSPPRPETETVSNGGGMCTYFHWSTQ